jgi:SAM-dependent methyltransferase
LEYFYHAYNYTTVCERTVELPIAREFIARHAKFRSGLEVGNVLSHYGLRPDRFEVIDKYELGEGVSNIDAVELNRPGHFDLIVSISTLEHVGIDDFPRDGEKVIRALKRLVESLTPGGALLFTIPVGYNPALDAFDLASLDRSARRTFLRRLSMDNRWGEAESLSREEAAYIHVASVTRLPDRPPYPFAGAICVWTIERPAG